MKQPAVCADSSTAASSLVQPIERTSDEGLEWTHLLSIVSIYIVSTNKNDCFFFFFYFCLFTARGDGTTTTVLFWGA
jgi:hypothetical protein